MERGLAEPLEDGALVARIGQGDQAAVSDLHARFSARIYFIALREMRSVPDAEDVRNETLLRVLEAIRGGRLASPGALPGFVASTARNVIREFGRKNRRAEPILDRDFGASIPDSPVDHKALQAIETPPSPCSTIWTSPRSCAGTGA